MEKTLEISLAEDRLRGARAIAKERGETVRQTYDALARGYIPGAWKEGKTWNARKSEIRRTGRRDEQRRREERALREVGGRHEPH